MNLFHPSGNNVASFPKTNADKIRFMTDEEMAEFLWKDCGMGNCPPVECKSKKCGAEKCWLNWLKQEATNG